MKRYLIAIVCALTLLPGVSLLARQQPDASSSPQRKKAAQDEFVPVTDLPPAEQMPAGPLVLGAYGFIWAAVLVYVLMLSRRLATVQKDIDSLKKQIRS